MANTQDFTNFFKTAPAAFDTAAVTDAWKTWATFGERFSAIALDAANKSNDITTKTVKDTLALLRGVTDGQDAPADYTKVVSDFGTAQTELVKTHFEALGDVAKAAQTDAHRAADDHGPAASPSRAARPPTPPERPRQRQPQARPPRPRDPRSVT